MLVWRGLTGRQLGALDAWTVENRGQTVEGGPIPTASGVIASAIDVALRVLDGGDELEMPRMSDHIEVLVECIESGPRDEFRNAVCALLAATNKRV